MFESGICFFYSSCFISQVLVSNLALHLFFRWKKDWGLVHLCLSLAPAPDWTNQPYGTNIKDCAGIAFRLPIICDINAAYAMAAQIKLRLLMERRSRKRKSNYYNSKTCEIDYQIM